MINIKLFLRYLLILFVAIAPIGCSEESDVGDDNNNDQIEKINASKIREEESGILGETSKSFVRIDAGRLQISSFLVLGEDKRSSLIRFAEIADKAVVSKIQSRVFIDKFINSGAIVRVGMELAYQSPRHKGEKTNLTLVKNQFIYKREGFRLSSKTLGCKNEDCSLFFESSVTEGGIYPVNQMINLYEAHTLSLEWDKNNFRFIYSFDKTVGFLDMGEFIRESGFSPKNFLYARLFVGIRNTDSTRESSKVIARFGGVFVNDVLYDDFGGEGLDSGKWKIGEIYR